MSPDASSQDPNVQIDSKNGISILNILEPMIPFFENPQKNGGAGGNRTHE